MKLFTRKQLSELGISEKTIINYRAGYYLKHGTKIWYYPDHRRLEPYVIDKTVFFYRLQDVILYKKDTRFFNLL